MGAVRLPEGFTGLTDPGWPRPRFLDSEGRILPVPWITPVENFASTDPVRRRIVKDKRLCQVCGEEHQAGTDVVIFLNGKLRAVPWAEEIDLKEYRNVILRAIDDGVLHERCARLAAGNCPKLGSMRSEEDLFSFIGPLDAIDLYEDPSRPLQYDDEALRLFKGRIEDLPRFETYLAMEGWRARVFEL